MEKVRMTFGAMVVLLLGGGVNAVGGSAPYVDAGVIENFESGSTTVFAADTGTTLQAVTNNGVVPAIEGDLSGSATGAGSGSGISPIADLQVFFTFIVDPGSYKVSIDVQAIADVQPVESAETSFDPNGILVSHSFQTGEFSQVAVDEWASPVFTLTAEDVDASGGVISGTLTLDGAFRWLFDNLRIDPTQITPAAILASIRQSIDLQAVAGGISSPYANDLHHRLDKIAAAIDQNDRRTLDLEMDKLLADLDRHIGEANKLTAAAAGELYPPLALLWRTARVPVFTDETKRVAGIRIGDDLPWTRDKSEPDSKYKDANKPAGASAATLGPGKDHLWWVCHADEGLAVLKTDENGDYFHRQACLMQKTGEKDGFDVDDPHVLGRIQTWAYFVIPNFTSASGRKNRTDEFLIWEERVEELPPVVTKYGEIVGDSLRGALKTVGGLGYKWQWTDNVITMLPNVIQGGTFVGGKKEAGPLTRLPTKVRARTVSHWYKLKDGQIEIETEREVLTPISEGNEADREFTN